MKKYFTLIILAFVFWGHAQTKKCSDYEVGDFIYPDNPNKVSSRSATKQESYDGTELQAVWDVKWSSECDYALTCEKVLTDKVPFKIGDVIKVTIVGTDDECYTFSCIVYNQFYPDGVSVPEGKMCRKKVNP